jgi:CRP/FNR family transcriptional regulator, cyclic AMP receptor protein
VTPPSTTAAHDHPYAQEINRAPMSDALRALARMGEVRLLRKGVQLITEGDVGDTLYILLKGQVRAFTIGNDGRELTYGTYDPGEYLGEMGLDGGERSANVETLTASVVVVVRRETLQRFLQIEPAFAFELLAKVIRRARYATVNLKQIALNDVYGRLKALLESLAPLQADGTRVADPAPSHKEMSQRLGCGREMVSRVMKDLQRGGYLDAGRRRVVLRKPLPAKW